MNSSSEFRLRMLKEMIYCRSLVHHVCHMSAYPGKKNESYQYFLQRTSLTLPVFLQANSLVAYPAFFSGLSGIAINRVKAAYYIAWWVDLKYTNLSRVFFYDKIKIDILSPNLHQKLKQKLFKKEIASSREVLYPDSEPSMTFAKYSE